MRMAAVSLGRSSILRWPESRTKWSQLFCRQVLITFVKAGHGVLSHGHRIREFEIPLTKRNISGGGRGIRTTQRASRAVTPGLGSSQLRAQLFSSSAEFVLSCPSGIIQCCPVQGFVLSSPFSIVLYRAVRFAARLQNRKTAIERAAPRQPLSLSLDRSCQQGKVDLAPSRWTHA
jgi:hypothetical protein